ncbi:class II aldolase/adducin family protein [Ornithinimicrobium tianjinense]|uniref:Class II aldolase n=1 Tax=Ornithinimicrobium tianjinense TaxID=1195761 RepID=A0A917F365_9MICO|nr:class II aldolase/adducin family protein [Ornithinimicrobium tianjinense]GGF40385.1 class II aldolase [Ornithinimicrobium tianjinense]
MSTVVQQMCRAGKHLAELGLSPGSSGNISVREGDRLYLSPTGVALADLDEGSVAVTALSPNGLDPLSGPRPSKEASLHAAMYLRDPSVTCVVHLHSTYAVAASCLPPWTAYSALPPLTPYLVMRLGNLPLVPYRAPGDPSQAQLIGDLTLDFHGVLLQNHGPVVTGVDVQQAVDRAVEVEVAARTAVLIGDRPRARLLSEQECRALARHHGQPWGLATAEETPT